jgi:DNA primase large subunit
MVSILVQKFRMDISRSLVLAAASFDQITENSRIGPLLQSMNQQYTGKDYTAEGTSGAELTSANIDELAQQSMPLCMRQTHKGLRRTHHLKYHARLQYGRFLKGAGMTMEEQTILMTREFTRLISQEEYNKKYAYSIRHMYGKEGARKNYGGYNCSKIILGPLPQSDQFHGCPFRHSDKESLSAMLRSLRLDGKAVSEIVQLQEKNQYNLACQKHFLAAHPGVVDMENVDCNNVGNHPNAWYGASIAYHEATNGRGGAATTSVKTELSSVTPIKTS